ncbi:MAG: hypothetical protein GF350_07035 [Chitinivibrionales bacterium]|nr:hypothetical protein [Chitinivibrionales bacterium]
MKISSGLFNAMVMQRTRRGFSDQRVEGTCPADSIIRIRVLSRGKALGGFAGKTVCRAQGKRFRFNLKGIPSGGPYTIVVSAQSKGACRQQECRNVLVGDVWALAGQSNMEGVGRLDQRAKPVDKVRAFYMDNRWDIAEDPVHNLKDALAPVHRLLNMGNPPVRPVLSGTGPGIAFAQEMYVKTGIPQGLIACSHGGSTVQQWSPSLKRKGTKSLYGALLHRIALNGGKIAGIAWYQGESDTNAADTPHFTRRTSAFIRSLRKDLKSPLLPVVLVQIGRDVSPSAQGKYWHSIREQQRKISGSIKKLALVASTDLSLDDRVHICGKDQQRLGKRIADAMAGLAGHAPQKKPVGIKRVRITRDKGYHCANIELEFSNIKNGLYSTGPAAGFALVQNGKNQHCIYRTDCSKNKIVLKTLQVPMGLDGLSLYYGFGANPYCNIYDGDDTPLPCFGPVSIGTQRLITPFVLETLISERVPIKQPKAKLPYPPGNENFGFYTHAFPDAFLSVHKHFIADAPASVAQYYKCFLHCQEPMNISICLGYDGPVHLWVDGKLLASDCNGTNPGVPDKLTVPVDLSKGKHEIIVGLSSNCGLAWGIFLRFERTDVSMKQAKGNGPRPALPDIVL